MRQQGIVFRLAQTVTDFIEPVLPYLIIGSKKAAEEAGKKVGPDVWEIKRELWRKLYSKERPELKEAAGNMVIAPYDSEVRQILVQEISKCFEKDPDLSKEVSFFMEGKEVQRIMAEEVQKSVAEEGSIKYTKQALIDKAKVYAEFNRMFEEFIERKSTGQGPENFEMSGTEETVSDQTIAFENAVKNQRQPYMHIQLNQGITIEGSPSSIRMAKIADFKQIESRIQDESQRLKNLLSQFAQLEGPEKEEFMEKALEFASNVQYGDLRSKILTLMLPILDGPRKIELIEKALYSASNIQDGNERALVFSSLAPHLRGPGKVRLIEDILAFAIFIRYGDAKFQLLSSLVPHLYGLKNEKLIEKALELVTVIHSDYQKIQALSFLITYLNEERQQEVIEQALEMAFNLKDKDMRPEALSYVLPYLDESRKKEILEKALDMASGIKSEYQKAEALASLAPYLDELEKEVQENPI
ncbi:hypothetical protein EQO05_00585 [Methanosarcina sp. MSH10X1]|uniref:hypothetical protein n=1 Tax=Methanosarcina sp. MSH10X1 TaxID=2507075 RepID=UPI000FFB0A55|nr:hypothetical protein [Methanosarcina sp. MSH10X1]RXA21775.1 hypothetical protein EQO05_00585 [Methanosarcina sp. MSH10X1]